MQLCHRRLRMQMSVVAVRKPFCGEMRSEQADAALPPRGSGSEDATNECGCGGAGGVHMAHYLVSILWCAGRVVSPFGAAGYNFRPVLTGWRFRAS